MTYALDRAQFERISSLSANARFEEFISRTTLHQQLWGLRSASGWAVGDLADCTPQAIALEAWLTRWTPGMEKDGTLVLVFPTNDDDDEGMVMSASEVEDALLGAMGGR